MTILACSSGRLGQGRIPDFLSSPIFASKLINKIFHTKIRTTWVTDFRNKSVLDACSMNLSYIIASPFNPDSCPSFIHSDDSGMRIMVDSDDAHGMFEPISIGSNWSLNLSTKLVPVIKKTNSAVSPQLNKLNLQVHKIRIKSLKDNNKKKKCQVINKDINMEKEQGDTPFRQT